MNGLLGERISKCWEQLCFPNYHFMFVVYFDHQKGAPHAVCWLQSILLTHNQFFDAITTFYVLFNHLMCKRMQKMYYNLKRYEKDH